MYMKPKWWERSDPGSLPADRRATAQATQDLCPGFSCRRIPAYERSCYWLALRLLHLPPSFLPNSLPYSLSTRYMNKIPLLTSTHPVPFRNNASRPTRRLSANHQQCSNNHVTDPLNTPIPIYSRANQNKPNRTITTRHSLLVQQRLKLKNRSSKPAQPEKPNPVT